MRSHDRVFIHLLPPSHRAVFQALTSPGQTEISSKELLSASPVSNLSKVVKQINAKLALVGDSRRLTCRTVSCPKGRGRMSYWTIIDIADPEERHAKS